MPVARAAELQRLLGAGGELTLRLGERDATFEVGGTRLTTRLIEGEFPNYRQLIPREPPEHADGGTRGAARGDPPRQDPRPRRHAGAPADRRPTRLQLTAITQDVGNAAEELDATLDGTELTVAFNPDYLAAGVEAVGRRRGHARDARRAEAGGGPRRRPARLPVPADAGAGAVARAPMHRASGWSWSTSATTTAPSSSSTGHDRRRRAQRAGQDELRRGARLPRHARQLPRRTRRRAGPRRRRAGGRARRRRPRRRARGACRGGAQPHGRNRVLVNRQRLAAQPATCSVRCGSASSRRTTWRWSRAAPAERRRFLDDTLVALAPKYDALRLELERILRQRNTLLKQAGGRLEPTPR